ncbi:MAG: hypothetical protein HYZ13_15090 [Acidobacteria bacterium]|nr:hypothetical protein [Acidobacteriota bacterium]
MSKKPMGAAGLADRWTAPFVHRALLGLLVLGAGVGLLGERNVMNFLPRASFHEGRWLGSPWFIGAMALAALSGWFQALRDPEPHWARRCLQLAPLVLLVGLVTSRLLGVRVPVDLRVGGTSEPILAAGGLRLRLEALKTDPRPPAFKLAAYTRPDGLGGFEAEPRSLSEKAGIEGRIPGTALRYQVESIIPHGLPNGAMVDDPASSENPALHVLLGLSQPNPLEGFLLARDPRRARFDEPGGRFAVVFQERFDGATLAALKAKPPAREQLVLTVQGSSIAHEARVGSTWQLPSFSLEVEALYPDFVAKPGADRQPRFGTRSAAPLNPWVQVRLRQPGGASALLMLAAHPPADPSYAGYLREVLPPGVELRYVREGEDPVDRFVLFTLADARVRLVVGGKVLREAPLEFRKPFTVAPGLSATPLEVFPRARFEEDWQPHPDPVQATRYENPVAKVKVSDLAKGTTETHWLAARGPQGPRPVAYRGGALALLFKKREPEPEQVHATLSLVDAAGETRAQGAVDVGEPLRPSPMGLLSVRADWETSNDPAAFRALVVRDPGRPILLFGLMQLGLGLVGLLFRRTGQSNWVQRR